MKITKKISVLEVKYLKSARSGDEKARSEVLKQYSNLVVSVANKYHNYFKTIDVSELVAEGNRGLLEAMDRYNPGSGAKFSTYAWFWIMKNVHEYVSSSTAIIDIPQKVRSNLKKISSAIENEIKKGKTLSLEAVSEKIDMDLGDMRDLLRDKKNITNPISISSYISQDDQDTTLEDVISDKTSSIRDFLEKAEENTGVGGLLSQLSDTESKVVKLRYGFVDNKYHTLKEVGKILKLPPAKIRDIESMAIMKLKKAVSETN